MNTHNNISHTGEKNFQNASPREDSSIRESAEPANGPIQQQEAHPDIQNHLAEAPGNMGEVNALSIAQDPQEFTNERLMTAQWIQDDTQRDAAYLSIAQDCNVPTSKRIKAAKMIEEGTQRDIAYLYIAQDPKVSSFCRLNAAKMIQNGTQRDAIYLSIAQDPKEATHDRLKSAKRIQDATQRDTAYLSIAQSTQEQNPTDFRLWAAELIQDAAQRDAAYVYIAQNSKENEFTDSRMSAVTYIQDTTQRDAVYVSIVQDFLAQNPTFYMDNDLLAYIESLLCTATHIIDQKKQEEAYQWIIENILRIDKFKYVNKFIIFSEKILNTQTKNIVAHTTKILNFLLFYRSRWGIKTLFRSLKTNQFNIESTGITDPFKLRNLIHIIILCFFFMLDQARYLSSHDPNPVIIKAHGYPAKSYWRSLTASNLSFLTSFLPSFPLPMRPKIFLSGSLQKTKKSH